jgi:O-antigen ligase
MTAELLARIGGPIAAAGFAVLLLAHPRAFRLAGLAALGLGAGLLVPILTPSGASPWLLAGGVVVVALAVGLALLFERKPWALAVLALVTIPARIPVPVGGEKNNLLVPLYAVVLGGAVWFGWSLWRGSAGSRELGALSWPLAAFVGWTGVSIAWTIDPDRAAVELLAFFLPFGVLAVALARLPWSERGVVWLCRLLLAMGLLFAAVGIFQWVTHGVFWNHKVIADNTFASFYRVNSLFWDPSIYGRFLVVAILVAVAVLLFGPWRRYDLALSVLVLVLWIGLFLSFSQSSFASLIVGLVVAGILAWRRRALAAVGVAAALLMLVGFGSPSQAAGSTAPSAAAESGLNRATRGRFDLLKNGLRIAIDHPVIGVGVGGFTKAYRESVRVPHRMKTPASHNTPVTVAAETGIVGLGIFAWFLVAAFSTPFRRTGSGPPVVRVAGIAAGLALTAIFVHSLFYNAFVEDPLMWGFLALAAIAARESGRLTTGRSATSR